MEKTGSDKFLSKIAKRSAQIDLGHKNMYTEGKEASGRVLFFAGINGAIDTFKQIQATKDPQIILSSERVFLQQDKHFCDLSDKLTIYNLDRSLKYLNDALRSIETVKSAPTYSAAETTHPTEHRGKRGNVPKDVVHNACNINCDRLDENNRTPRLDMAEKALIKQRKANLVTAKTAYIEMQQEALGLPKGGKESDKDRER